MLVVLKRSVKYGGAWYTPGASLDVDEKLAKELVAAEVADASPEAPEDNEPDRENETPTEKKARLKAEAKERAKQEREANK